MKISAPALPSPRVRPRWGGHLVIFSIPADINECLTLGLCKDSECVNTRGSYLCTCRPGLMLDPSRSRCVCECWWGPGVGDTGRQDETLGIHGPRAEISTRPHPRAQCQKLKLELDPMYNNGSVSYCWNGDSSTSFLALGISLGTLQFEVFYFV